MAGVRILNGVVRSCLFQNRIKSIKVRGHFVAPLLF